MKKLLGLFLILTLFAITASPCLSAINVATVNYGGDCNSAYLTISSGTITVDLDDVKDFNISVQGYTAVTLDISDTAFTITRDANTTNTDFNITSAAYNTVGELLAALEARDDITIVRWDNLDTSRACTELNDVSAQDINGSTIYTGLRTTSYQFKTTTYPKFSGLETAFEAIPKNTVAWSTANIQDNKTILSTSTLDDQSKTTIKAKAVTLTAGGTVSSVHDPFYKITGTIDDVLFGMQVYRHLNWQIVYSDGTSAIAVSNLK